MQKYKINNKYVIRKPLFSYDILFNNNRTKNLEEVVNEMIENDDFVASIYWSSPDLYEIIAEYKQGSLNKEKASKLFHTLKKYAIRASTRTTPYGTMAGIAFKDSSTTDRNSEQILRKARIDMEFLNEIKCHIESNSALKNHLKYKVNNTSYKIHDQYRYQEPLGKESDEKFQLCSLEANEFLDQLSEPSEFTDYNEIINSFSSDFSANEVISFIDELIDIKFLISELQPILTADNSKSIANIIQRILNEGNAAARIYLDLLEKIDHCISVLESTPLSHLPLLEINEIKNTAKALGIEKKHIFHVDLKHNSESRFSIENAKIRNISTAVSILQKFGSQNGAFTEIENFKRIFSIKYESAEIPLPEVLDSEFGIGFPTNLQMGNITSNSLIEGLGKADQDSGKASEPMNFNFLLDAIEKENAETIHLEDFDWEKLDEKPLQSQNFHIAGFSYEDYFFLQNIGSSTANSVLGRFGSIDENIEKFCSEIHEQDTSQILFPELIYIPEKRTANISRRPRLSEYEIPIFAESSCHNTHQILLNDIMVSVQKDEIILRSKKLNKRIIPRLSNAHNFHKSENSAYRFLATLQSQEQYNYNLNINYSKTKKRFFPRIVFKDIILHRACWLLHENDVQNIKSAPNPLFELKTFLQKWKVHQYVVLVQGDNELFLDTTNESYLNLLIEEIKTKKNIHLSEWLETENNANKYTEQVILSLENKNFKAPVFKTSHQVNNIQRNFAPGSEWLYIKIYCNSNISDYLLSEIEDILDECINNKSITSTFFIRYTDPHYHLRLRLHLADHQYYSKVLGKLHTILDPYFQQGIIWNLQLDSYQREIERYSPEYIEAAEQAFYHDSKMILNLLHHEIFIENEEIRLFSAVKNVDQWLNVFNFSLKEKLKFCRSVEANFIQEFDLELKRHIASKFRDLGDALNNFFKMSYFEMEFNERNKSISQLILNKEHLPSYIHMSINRWFTSEQRALEFMTYSFAVKYYNRLLSQSE